MYRNWRPYYVYVTWHYTCITRNYEVYEVNNKKILILFFFAY